MDPLPASIIVIAYNEEKYIDRCVDSIMKQSYKDFELIVVNDGSTDNTAEIVKGYKDCRIKLVQHYRNQGYSSARNSGLENAQGHFIFFTDADCIVNQKWIESGIEFFKANPEICALTGKVDIEYAKSSKSYRHAPWLTIPIAIGTKCIVPNTINCAFRKEVFETIGNFSIRYNNGGEDIDFGLKTLSIFKTEHCKRMLVTHQYKKLSISRGLHLAPRSTIYVKLIKDHRKDYPILLKLHTYAGYVIHPEYLARIMFPPLILLDYYRSVGVKKINMIDLAFLVPIYFGLVYARICCWGCAVKEKIMLI